MKCVSFFRKGKLRGKPVFFSQFKESAKGFMIFFILFFASFNAHSQFSVTLGNNLAICEGENLKLSDLNPLVTGSPSSSWWSSSGDGIFSPNDLYPGAVYYTPGPNDILNESFTITLTIREFEPNGPQHSDQATVYIQYDPPFACNDMIIVPLNLKCEFLVIPPMVLEGEPENEPYNLYELEIYDTNGVLVPGNLLNKTHIDQVLSYTISHKCGWNSCGGIILAKDNFMPVMSCRTDTVTCMVPTDPETFGFPINESVFNIDTLYKTGDNKYTVEGWDACGDVDLSYHDSIKIYSCSENQVFQELIIRYWKATDESNNTARCRDTIRVKRINLDSIIFPPSWDDIDTTALECDGDWLETALPDGNPSPEYTGSPETWFCNQFSVNYSDQKFNACGNTFTIVRTWTIADWCTSEVIHHNQIIKVMDTNPPVIECVSDTIIIGADPYECSSQRFELPIPSVSDACSGVDIFVKVYNAVTNVQQPVQVVGNKFFIQKLPLALYRVVIVAIDKCLNKSECVYYIRAIDDKAPYIACDHYTKVSIGTNGKARLNAESIDDGSFDNCGIKNMLIRKMTYECDSIYFEYGPFVDFCCSEANTQQMVQMKVTDHAGNSNSCMVMVTVEDKLPPLIYCPPGLTVSCDFHFDPDSLDIYFGKVVKDIDLREDIVIHDYYNNGVVGQDGYAYDNCDVEITQTVANNLNNCNVGNMIRTFTATDEGGRTNQCTQTIVVLNPFPFNYYGDDIIWPKDTIFYGCSNLQADTSITGSPKVNDNMCSLVAMLYEDQVFPVQAGACEKIIRKWTVRDWCQSIDLFWTKEQVIMLYNEEAPVFTSNCENREICVYGQCEGPVQLHANATDDCTPPENLYWTWKVDLDQDGIYDLFGQGNHFSRNMEIGDYTISWTVEDKCGNKSVCTYDFKVKDCKNPTPLCITDLTTVVMEQSGMVSVNAKSFDHGSYDNCTNSNYGTCGCLTDLLFSFSTDVNDSLFTVTCDDMAGAIAKTFTLDMWVTDEAGNQDYCTVFLQVQDNFDVCPGSSGITVSGLLANWSQNKPVNGINVLLQSVTGETNRNNSTATNGRFDFSDLAAGQTLTVEPQDDKSSCMAGISTADIVRIQKHILNIEKFDIPYQFIAADVNKSKTITAADILDLRRMILGITENLPGKCWEYVDAKEVLNINNPYIYKSKLQYDNLNSNILNADFKVIKMGDVNDSYNASGLIPRNMPEIEIYCMDTDMSKGKDYDIPLYIDHGNGIEGMQFTIGFDTENLMFMGYKHAQIAPTESNFGHQDLDDGYVTFSWNTFTNKYFDKNEPVLYLTFRALNNSLLSDNLTVNSDITQSLAVVESDDVPLNFRFESNSISEGLLVYQNNPNPFKNNTTISFYLPEADNAEFKVYDATGKLLYISLNDYEKGLHHITIERSDINARGVLYYSIKVKNDIVMRKMILID